MKFSLIVATLGRFSELEVLLDSLAEQQHKDFEVIIVDQNTEIDLQPLVAKYSSRLALVYIHSEVKGLSVNRNKGLAVASGEIICFPDDDCHYFPDTLKIINGEFEIFPDISFLLGNLNDFSNIPYEERPLKNKNSLNTLKFLKKGCSAVLFYRKNASPQFRFDERLGIGAEFGSGEDTDCLLHLFSLGCKGSFYPALFIHHPAKYKKPDVVHIQKYAVGFGAVMKKGVLHYKIKACYLIFLRYVLSACVKALLPSKSKFGRAYLISYIKGFREYD